MDKEIIDQEPFPHPSENPDRVIVLMGRTGAGKSALANCIGGKSDVFTESSGTGSETLGTPDALLAVRFEGRRYVLKIIDTIGFGDNRLPMEDVLLELAYLASKCRGGIHQLIFVTSNRFTEVEEDAFDLVQSVIFQPTVLKHTTVVRTKCPDFEDPGAESKVREDLQRDCKLMKNIKTFIVIDNPPMQGSKRRQEVAAADRIAARQKLLTHLIGNCTEQYNPDNLQEVNARIGRHLHEAHRLDRELAEERAKANASEACLARLEAELADSKHEATKALLRNSEQARADLQKKLDSNNTRRRGCNIM